MGPFTLDSNILIYHLQEDRAVTRALEEWLLGGTPLFISVITRIELIAAPTLRNDDEAKILRFLDQFILVPVDAQIADVAARVRRSHRLALGDSIIAATALLRNAALVTRNVRDFAKVTGLGVITI